MATYTSPVRGWKVFGRQARNEFCTNPKLTSGSTSSPSSQTDKTIGKELFAPLTEVALEKRLVFLVLKTKSTERSYEEKKGPASHKAEFDGLSVVTI